MHMCFASISYRKARRRNTHNPLMLHTYYSEAFGIGSMQYEFLPQESALSPREHAAEFAWLLYAPCKCSFLVVGTEFATFCQLKNLSLVRNNKNKETKQTIAMEVPEECNDYNKRQ